MIALREEFDTDFVKRVSEMFSPNGLLSKARHFEYREEQQQMAVEVARALGGNTPLVVEAGTGVGKSLAYLVPAVLFAVENKRKAVISTHTINLQEQLLFKDIPVVQKILPVEFEAVLLKGRQNYFCPRRLERAMQQQNDLFTSPEQEELKRIHEWSLKTDNGTLSDFAVEPDSKVWAQVCSEAHLCTTKTCGKDPRCFYQAARKRMLTADVLVMNHTLFFLHLGSAEELAEQEGGFLFPNDFVIFDEAHTVEAVAAQQIGIGVSQYGLRHLLHRLYNPKSKKGLWTVLRNADGVRTTAALIDEADAFFTQVEERCAFKKGREYRVRSPDLVSDTITGGLAKLQELVVKTLREMEDETTKAELQDLGRRVRDARLAIATFLTQEEDEYVYWVEKSGKSASWINLHAAPVDVSPFLEAMLFRPDTCCIMTSATISTGRPGLEWFRNRIGAEGVRAVEIGSPFDYEKQMKLFVPKSMPDPRDAAYDAALEKWIAHFVTLSGGSAFVLFTSYRTMEALADRMERFFDKAGIALLVQGRGLPRHQLIQEFKKDKESVLFGTDSFWTGVDVPGDALSNVIITRLPFAVPDHPLTEARLEMITSRGGDAFSEYSLPEAILKLRQGVGRLIRTRSDSGIVAILDNRILNKPYGKAFLAALPRCPVEVV